ncbi:MAG: hypothetical protein ACLQMF_01100 [Rectinemataceae bacterium]
MKRLIASIVLAAAALPVALVAEATGMLVTRGPDAANPLPLHLKLAGMTAAEAPQVFEDRLVLSAFGPYRFVGAAFAHEGFAVIHPFARNRQGVFVLAYPIPLKRSAPLVYRLVIDGVWTFDSSNPRRANDPETGAALSIADVPYLSDLHLGLYRILGSDGRTAHFVFQGAPGELVTVSGDFNDWDPFIYEMSETRPGLYELSLPLTPGRHYYDFVYRGDYVPDPLNGVKAATDEGRVVSVITVPSQR